MSMIAPSPLLESDGSRGPKACVPCAYAKVKCELGIGDGTCKRCQRLRKPCRPQSPGAHKRKPGGRKSDVARLEQKLDGVAAILAASERMGVSRESSRPLPVSSTSVVLSPVEYIEEFSRDESETALILDVFRTEMTPLFPFVVLPRSLGVQDLKERRPFLLLVALAVACRHEVPRQAAMVRKAREVLTQKVFMEGEQSLDILQGLLLLIAWYHIHLHLSKQLTSFTHLAMAMVVDLGLHIPDFTQNPPKPSKEYFRQNRHAMMMRPRTLEERRTFLGCFYITSVISTWARDVEPLRYDKYANESCRLLSEAAEYPSDVFAAQLAKLLCISEKIKRTLAIDEWDPSTKISAPIGFCVKMLDAELQEFKKAIPPLDHLQSTLLLINYYTIESGLYETALNDNVDPVKFGDFPLTRVSMLYACLNATKSSLEAFFSLPISVTFDLPYTIWSLTRHMLVVASKLALFTGEGWDQSYVRNHLDFFEILNKLLRRLEDTKTTTTNTSSPQRVPEPFTTFAQKMQMARDIHEAHRAAQSAPDRVSSLSHSDVGETTVGIGMPIYPDDFNFNLQGSSAALFEFLDDDLWNRFT